MGFGSKVGAVMELASRQELLGGRRGGRRGELEVQAEQVALADARLDLVGRHEQAVALGGELRQADQPAPLGHFLLEPHPEVRVAVEACLELRLCLSSAAWIVLDGQDAQRIPGVADLDLASDYAQGHVLSHLSEKLGDRHVLDPLRGLIGRLLGLGALGDSLLRRERNGCHSLSTLSFCREFPTNRCLTWAGLPRRATLGHDSNGESDDVSTGGESALGLEPRVRS